jgi:hypothetical protein
VSQDLCGELFPGPAIPDVAISSIGTSGHATLGGPAQPHSAVIGLPTQFMGSANRPFEPNDSSGIVRPERWVVEVEKA